MSYFFDKFPTTFYDINKAQTSNYQTVTNIFIRVGVIQKILNNIGSYYEYVINPDTDRPEILAEKVYGNAEAHWLILYTNQIFDPQYDWPLGYDAFNKYIIKKYGSIELAKTTIHHYEKVIERENVTDNVKTINRYDIQYQVLNNNLQSYVPNESYLTLPETQEFNTYNVNGKTIKEKIYRNSITNFDYEIEKNDKKRNIIIIKSEYYTGIVQELETLLGVEDNYIRNFASQI